MTDLLKLAERVESATGPDRELDCAILVAIDWRYDDWEEGEHTAREMADKHGLAWLVSRSVEGYNSTWRHLPRLTASLDAAMTLVPEVSDSPGEHWSVEKWVKQSAHPAHVMATAWVYGAPRTYAATPALALTAAALKARASLQERAK